MIIKKYISNKNTLIFIGVLLFSLLFLRQCNKTESLKVELERTRSVADRNFNNYKAAQDTIRLEKNKYSEIVAIKNTYEYEINSLSNSNKKIINDYKKSLNIIDKLDGVNSLLKAELSIKDSILNSSSSVTMINDTSYQINFNDQKKWDKYNWRRFNGTIDVLRDSLTNNLLVRSSQFNFEQGIELKAAILNKEGVNSLRITTPYPGIEFTNIENINLVNDRLNKKYEKKAGWSIGVGFGYGINLNNNQVVSTGPSINIGVMWSPKWLRF